MYGSVNVADSGERITIRHIADRVEWRRTNGPSDPFEIVGVHISNDADGNGTTEPMFTADATPPTRITVQITAESPVPDIATGEAQILQCRRRKDSSEKPLLARLPVDLGHAVGQREPGVYHDDGRTRELDLNGGASADLR